MSVRKFLVGVTAAAVGLGAVWFSRGKEGIGASSKWARSTRLAVKLDHPLGVAVDGNYVYFVTGGFANADNAVLRILAAGGTAEKLAQLDQIVSGNLIVDGDYVYLTSEGTGTVLRVPKAGGAATVFARAPGAVHLASDATHIYLVTFSQSPETGTLQRVAKSGGAPEVLLRGHPGMDQLVVDDRAVYFRSNKGLWSVAKSGGEAKQLIPSSEQKNLDRLIGDATHLYFFYESKNPGRYEVARLPKAGGIPEAIGPIAVHTGRLALSDTHVYFFREESVMANSLAKVAKTGGAPETVDGSGYSTGHLGVGAGSVFFTDIGNLYRAPQ